MKDYNPEEYDYIQGLTNTKELLDIYDNVLIVMGDLERETNILEIGSYQGKSAHAICSAMMNKNDIGKLRSRLYFIDDWSKDGSSCEEFMINIMNNKDFSSLNKKMYTGKADEYAECWCDEYFDLMFHDGSHEYPQVLKDLENYWPKLKIGGIWLMHDYRPHLPDRVAVAVQQFFGKGNFKRLSGTLIKTVKGSDGKVDHQYRRIK